MMRVDPAARIEVVPLLQAVRADIVEAYLAAYFDSEILPLLTPIALDGGHPLPPLPEGTRGIVVRFRRPCSSEYGVVLVHSSLPPAVEAPAAERVPLEHVIARRVSLLFQESPIECCWAFRICVSDDGRAEAGVRDVERFLSAELDRSRRRLRGALPRAA